jgi:hypothetical protein
MEFDHVTNRYLYRDRYIKMIPYFLSRGTMAFICSKFGRSLDFYRRPCMFNILQLQRISTCRKGVAFHFKKLDFPLLKFTLLTSS